MWQILKYKWFNFLKIPAFSEIHIFKSVVFHKCAQLPLGSWVIKGGLFVHFSSSGEGLGKTIADIRWRVRCFPLLNMGFGCRDSLCEDFKYETQRSRGWGLLSWGVSVTSPTACSVTQQGKGTVLRRDWPWLVENSLWNYPSWDNKQDTVRGKAWSLEQDCWDLVIQMTLNKFFHLSEPQFPHLWIGNSIS